MENKIDKELKSERLLYRKLTLLDIDDMFEYTSNENCTYYLSWEAHTIKDQVATFIKNTLEEYKMSTTRFTWGIELIDENKLIGAISIFDISYFNKRVEISYILNPKYQGKGYMTEALNTIIRFIFNELDFIRVQARCSEDNLPSEKVMKKINMKYEGKLIKYWKIKNKHKNVLIYAKIKEK